MKILSPIDKLDENIDISSTLCSSSRILYPKLAKKCKTDMLLPRRMQLKLGEERSIVTKNASTPKHVPEVNILTIYYHLNIKMKVMREYLSHFLFAFIIFSNIKNTSEYIKCIQLRQ